MDDLKQIACDAIDGAAEELHGLSDAIWNHPELGFKEIHAHEVLTKYLLDKGFQASLFHYYSCYVFSCILFSKKLFFF